MLVRAFGFFIDESEFPDAMNFNQAFEALAKHGVAPLDNKGIYHGCASLITTTFRGQQETWWTGIILKVRDAKTFNKLVSSGGRLTMTADQLQDGKIAESSYFIASPATGKGLMASYQGSPGMALLEWAIRKVFKKVQTLERTEAWEAATGTKAKTAAAAQYRGKLKIWPLIREGSLKDLLKEFRKVARVEFKVGAVQSQRLFFRAPKLKSSTQIEKYYFEPNFNFEDAEVTALVKEMNKENTVVVVEGEVAGGANETVSNVELRNKQLFGSVDYDQLHGTFVFEHGDDGSNVANSPVVEWLTRLLNNARTHGVLTTPQIRQ